MRRNDVEAEGRTLRAAVTVLARPATTMPIPTALLSWVAFRRKLYHTLEELQADLDRWLREYNEERTHQGRWCYGKTPLQTFLDSVPLAKEKMLAA